MYYVKSVVFGYYVRHWTKNEFDVSNTFFYYLLMKQ
jgi:hypothetical protein